MENPGSGERKPREVHEIETARRLEDDGRRGEQPIRDDYIPRDYGDSTRVSRAAGEEHVESGADAGAEEKCRGEYVQPFDDEIFHQRGSSSYNNHSAASSGRFFSTGP